VEEWLARRRGEGAHDTDLLFGYPDGARRVWHWHRTASLLGQLLKAASGDRSLSLHALRHAKVTDFAVTLPLTPDGERQFELFSAQRGHESSEITRRHYDHSGDKVLRRVLAELEVEDQVSYAAGAQWLGVSEAALRKRASRSTLPRAAFLAQELAAKVNVFAIPDVRIDFEFCERVAPEHLANDSEGAFASVLCICRELDAGASSAAVALRHDWGPAKVLRIARMVIEEARLSWSTDQNDARLQYRLHEAFERVRRASDFSRLEQPKHARVLEFAQQPANEDKLLAAVRAWTTIRLGPYLSLERPERAMELVEFLAAAGVKSEQLVARIAPLPEDSADDTRHLERAVTERIASFFRQPVPLQRGAGRRGRPRAYLLFAEEGGAAASAAVSARGLNALMLAASIWQCMRLEKVQ
ncbi:MAG: hypothetical protein ABW110_22395, partial [Steroidobacteraceae bacterium]